MTWIAISIPVMVLALAIATGPVIFAMVAEHKLRSGDKAPPDPTANPNHEVVLATEPAGPTESAEDLTGLVLAGSALKAGARRPAGPLTRPDRGARTRARRARVGLAITVVASGLGAVAVGLALPAPAGAAMTASSIYVSNRDSSTVTSYPTSANGDAIPTTAFGNLMSLNGPYLSTFDAAGDLWVANFFGNTVVEFTPAQLAATGSPTPAVVLYARAGSLDEPSGLTFGSSGGR